MIRSMTAYGRGEYEFADYLFIAEMRSLNNRYRDVVIRVPRTLQVLEDEIRSLISSRIKRGRIEVSIQVDKKGKGVDYALELNQPLINSYLRIFKQLGDEFGLDQNMSIDTLCQMKDVLIIKPEEMDINDARTGVEGVLSEALDSLDRMRLQEGGALEKDFQKRLELIGKYLDSIEERSPLVVEEYQKRLRQRIADLSEDIDLDEGRLIQEVAIFAGKSDVTEEIVRTRSHLEQFRNYMSMEDSIGRRLDFLIQEINREVNTVSSKASDSSIATTAVEIKAELEKLREQIQNVE